MHRAVTAIYRSYEVADLVRNELDRLGLRSHHVTVLPGTRIVPNTRDASDSTRRSDEDLRDAMDRLHDLHLPENDTRTYQQAIRNGNFVVSAEVDDGVDLARVQEIMRRPEDSYDLNDLNNQYSSATYESRREPLGSDYDERWAGRYDETASSPYTRAYNRDAPLGAGRRDVP